MIINLDIKDFFRRNLPVHMLQPNRLNLYWLIMREISGIYDNYLAFRENKRIEKNITYSKKSLEWWLNRQVFGSGEENKLAITFGSGNTYFAGLEKRETGDLDYIELSLESDGLASVELARRSDDFGSITTDFVIESQVALTDEQKEQINLIVEQFRTAGVDYQITI